MKEYTSQPAWILQGEKVLTDPQQVEALRQQFAQQQQAFVQRQQQLWI